MKQFCRLKRIGLSNQIYIKVKYIKEILIHFSKNQLNQKFRSLFKQRPKNTKSYFDIMNPIFASIFNNVIIMKSRIKRKMQSSMNFSKERNIQNILYNKKTSELIRTRESWRTCWLNWSKRKIILPIVFSNLNRNK